MLRVLFVQGACLSTESNNQKPQTYCINYRFRICFCSQNEVNDVQPSDPHTTRHACVEAAIVLLLEIAGNESVASHWGKRA